MQPNVLVKINALDNTKETFSGLRKNLDHTSKEVERVSSGFGSLAKTMVGVAAAYVSVGRAYDALSLGIKVAADLQTAEIGLTTLLGSADQAEETVKRLKVEAARTPFELPGLAQATQLLASVTKDGNKSIDILLDIGEGLAAMGKGQAELDRIIVNLQQIAATGKAATIDIKQFAFAGIPIYEMLEEYFAKNPIKTIANHNNEIAKTSENLAEMRERLRLAKMQMSEFTDTTKKSTVAAKQLQIRKLTEEIASAEGALAGYTAANGKASSSVIDIEEAIESGAVTFDVLTEVFDQANDEGGRFFNAFANQAGSFNQAASNMKDSFGIMMADIVTKSGLFDGVTEAMVSASNAMGNWQGIASNLRDTFTSFVELLDERTGIVTHLKLTFDAIATTFREYVKPSIDEFLASLEPLRPLGENLALVFGTMFFAALHTVVFVLNLAITAIGLVVAGLAQLATLITTALAASIDYLAGVIRLVVALFTGDWAGAIDVVEGAIESLVGWVEKLINKFMRAIELAKEIGGGAINFVKSALPGRASGGPVTASMPYMVGEAGPELFVPRQSGSIIPNGALAGVGAGIGGPNIVINIAGTFMDDRTAARRLSDEIMAQLRQQTRL